MSRLSTLQDIMMNYKQLDEFKCKYNHLSLLSPRREFDLTLITCWMNTCWM